MLVILIGPPGSGKGTQGKILASELRLPYLSTGDMLRKMIESGEPIGKSLKEYVDTGKLIPSDLINNMAKEFISTDECLKGCVLDGYPRSLEQAEFLDNISNQPFKVIHFDIKDEEIIKRISGRFSCSVCNKNYNLYFDKPKIENICDDCGSSHFTHRRDDNEKIVKERLEVYNTETFPLIEYYRNLDGFYSIDAGKNKEEIAGLLSDLLKRI